MIKKYILPLVLLALLFLPSCMQTKGERTEVEQKDTVLPLGFLTDTLDMVGGRVKEGEFFSTLAGRLGLDGATTYQLTQAAEGVFDLRQLRAGNAYEAYYTTDSLDRRLQYLVYYNTKVNTTVFRTFDSLAVWKADLPVKEEMKTADVTITSSLWYDMSQAGASPLAILKLSDIYAWTVDFFGLQAGDRFRLAYSQRSYGDEVLSVDTVYFAIYTHADKDYPMIMLDQHDGGNIYWNEKGESMRKAFLKAPLHYSRISSTYSTHRVHPVTRKVRPHLAVDYAAPKGTPVMAIGDGTVLSAANSGASGNMVKIRHNSVYTTAYLHLSKFGPGIKAGTRVSQGLDIGYVGSTGVSTGPHLDFRVWKNGSPINPLKLESPPMEPLKEEYRPQLDSLRTMWMERFSEQQ